MQPSEGDAALGASRQQEAPVIGDHEGIQLLIALCSGHVAPVAGEEVQGQILPAVCNKLPLLVGQGQQLGCGIGGQVQRPHMPAGRGDHWHVVAKTGKQAIALVGGHVSRWAAASAGRCSLRTCMWDKVDR